MAYKLKYKIEVVNTATGEIEDTLKGSTRKLDSADVSDMRKPLIAVLDGWNTHGIEGQGAAAQSRAVATQSPQS